MSLTMRKRALTYLTVQGDTVDAICVRHYKSARSEFIKAVYAVNPDLGDSKATLTPNLTIILPDRELIDATLLEDIPTVELWKDTPDQSRKEQRLREKREAAERERDALAALGIDTEANFDADRLRKELDEFEREKIVNGDDDPLRQFLHRNPASGRLEVKEDVYKYFPDVGFAGNDFFEIITRDNDSEKITRIEVAPCQSGPQKQVYTIHPCTEDVQEGQRLLFCVANTSRVLRVRVRICEAVSTVGGDDYGCPPVPPAPLNTVDGELNDAYRQALLDYNFALTQFKQTPRTGAGRVVATSWARIQLYRARGLDGARTYLFDDSLVMDANSVSREIDIEDSILNDRDCLVVDIREVFGTVRGLELEVTTSSDLDAQLAEEAEGTVGSSNGEAGQQSTGGGQVNTTGSWQGNGGATVTVTPRPHSSQTRIVSPFLNRRRVFNFAGFRTFVRR